MKIRKGTLIEVVLWDHSEGRKRCRIVTRGRLIRSTKHTLIIKCWGSSVNELKLEHDEASFTILKADVIKVTRLVRSEVLYEALQKASVPAKLHIVKGAGHSAGVLRRPEIKEKVRKFFDSSLKKGR